MADYRCKGMIWPGSCRRQNGMCGVEERTGNAAEMRRKSCERIAREKRHEVAGKSGKCEFVERETLHVFALRRKVSRKLHAKSRKKAALAQTCCALSSKRFADVLEELWLMFRGGTGMIWRRFR
jgi:hypothetical protein